MVRCAFNLFLAVVVAFQIGLAPMSFSTATLAYADGRDNGQGHGQVNPGPVRDGRNSGSQGQGQQPSGNSQQPPPQQRQTVQQQGQTQSDQQQHQAQSLHGARVGRTVLKTYPADGGRRHYDVVHLHIGGIMPARVVALALVCTCVPWARTILTFHSGEDRRVKKAFQAGLNGGVYADIAGEVIRPMPEERDRNPRSSSAKLRWAIKNSAG